MISYTLSLRYAKSIFSLAKETNSIDSYYEQLKEVDIVLEKSADLKEVLESQRVAAKDKLHLVEKIFYSQNLAKNVYNFLKFLALRNRFMIFKEILKVFDDLYHQHKKSLDLLLRSKVKNLLSHWKNNSSTPYLLSLRKITTSGKSDT